MTTDAEQKRYRHLRAALRQHLQDAAEVAQELPKEEHALFLVRALDAWPILGMSDELFNAMLDALFSDGDKAEQPISQEKEIL
jgi:hypothetical protein